MNRYGKFNYAIWGAAFLALFALWFFTRNNERDMKIRVGRLMREGEFAIGKITGRTYSSRPYSLSSIMYRFTADGKVCEERFSWLQYKVMPENVRGDFRWPDDAMRNTLRLVVYDPDDPRNSVVCLGCPIADSADFVRYVQWFTTRAKDGFRSCGHGGDAL